MREDEALWTRIGRRDAEAFEKFYTDHFGRVCGFLRIYLGNSAAVADLAQDTFLQLWRNPNGFDPSRASLVAYLMGIARKKAADWWRRQPSAQPVAESTATDETAALLEDALARLDSDLRNILWLREVEGYSYDELARILEIPLGTVRSRLFAAREQLRRIWKA